MSGMVELHYMSFFSIVRQFLTASLRLRRLYEATMPDLMDARDMKVTLVLGPRGCGDENQ